MSKLSRSVVGALILPMAFLPSAAWGSTLADSTPTAPASTSAPGATGTAAPTTTTTPTVTATSKRGSGSEDFGNLSATPATGVPGTKINVSSVTKCVDAERRVGKGAVAVLITDQENPDPLDVVVVTTKKDGSWTATLTVPKSAKSGDVYLVTGGCFLNVPDESEAPEEEPFLIYYPVQFKVTGAQKAPVATPVTKSPTFTG